MMQLILECEKKIEYHYDVYTNDYKAKRGGWKITEIGQDGRTDPECILTHTKGGLISLLY